MNQKSLVSFKLFITTFLTNLQSADVKNGKLRENLLLSIFIADIFFNKFIASKIFSFEIFKLSAIFSTEIEYGSLSAKIFIMLFTNSCSITYRGLNSSNSPISLSK